MTDKSKQALEHFTKLQTALENKIQQFTTNFQKNPHNALEWGDSTFSNVAMLEQIKRAIYYLTPYLDGDVLSLPEIEEIFLKNLLNHNSCLSNSTSQCTNLLAFYKGKAITEVLQQLKYFK